MADRSFLEYVDKVGRRLDHFTDSGPGGIGASIYLYELQG